MTTVVKLGGSLLESAELRAIALDAIVEAHARGERLVIVHGGGKHVDSLLGRLGIPKVVRGGLRVTDARTLEIVVATLAGTVSKLLVRELFARGVKACGISGADGATLTAVLHEPIHGDPLGFVGRPSAVDLTLVDSLGAGSILPLVASVAIGESGELLNVNADSAAAAIASAASASRLVFLTDVEGVLDANGTLVESLDRSGCETLLASPAITGGMRPKLLAAVSALDGGVGEVVIAGPSRHTTALIEGKGGTHLVAA